jgi:hypothetical protein
VAGPRRRRRRRSPCHPSRLPGERVLDEPARKATSNRKSATGTSTAGCRRGPASADTRGRSRPGRARGRPADRAARRHGPGRLSASWRCRVTDVSGSAIGTAGLEDALVGEACCVALCRGCRPQLARWRSVACGVGEPVPTLTEAAVSSGDSSIERCGARHRVQPEPGAHPRRNSPSCHSRPAVGRARPRR